MYEPKPVTWAAREMNLSSNLVHPVSVYVYIYILYNMYIYTCIYIYIELSRFALITPKQTEKHSITIE